MSLFLIWYDQPVIDIRSIKAAGLTVKELGELAGIDRTAISRAINQTKTGPTYTLVKLIVAVWPLLDEKGRAVASRAMRDDLD